MGNHRFRLSDMIPNAWFYKLKDMGRARNQKNINLSKKKKQPPTSSSSSSSSSLSSSLSQSTAAPTIPTLHQSKTEQPHLLSHQRKSHYFTRDLTPHDPHNTHFPDFPRKSPKQSRNSPRRNRNRNRNKNRVSDRPSPKLGTASVSASCGCRATLDSVLTKPDSTSEDYPNSPPESSSDPESLFPELGSDHDPPLPSDSFDAMVSLSSSCRCKFESSDIVIDIIDDSLNTKFDGFNSISEVELPPIITKNPETKTSIVIEQRTTPVRRHSATSPGLRLRTNSPRIASKKIQAAACRKSLSSLASRSRRSLSESFAVVKSSADPQRDFKESMVEMILENNIRGSKDLEDLLACYLQLNSDEYHEIIIKVFKQIWFDLAGIRLK